MDPGLGGSTTKRQCFPFHHCSTRQLPCPTPHSAAAATASPAIIPGPDLPCKQEGSTRLHFPAPAQGWMLCTDQSEAKRLQREAEKHWPGISRRERDEADFDAKSGREAESSRRGLIGRCLGLGALCKCLRSISAWNQIISTRATD